MSGSKTVKQAAAEELRREGRPLPLDELVAGVMNTEGLRLSGKTPGATISAQLYVDAKKPDGLFELVRQKDFRAQARVDGG